MNPVSEWTGRTACLLQAALRLSNETFAERLGIAVRTVAAWHQKPGLRPKSEMQQLLDTALEQASEAAQARFVSAVADLSPTPAQPGREAAPDRAADAESRLSADPNIGTALGWLDRHAGWEPGTSRRKVALRLARLDARDLHDRRSRRERVDQRRIAHALGEYYGDRAGRHGRYTARIDHSGEAVTSVLTCGDWLDLDCPLTPRHDRLTLASGKADGNVLLEEEAAGRAAQRLAETLATGIRLVDMPLYQLLAVTIHKGMIAGSLGITHFVRYALTMDLLEGELVDALADGVVAQQGGTLPLRDRYLPDVASVLGVADRLCAGGALALCAIARPASLYRGEPDYLLLVQERSADVVNAVRRLAVIPKGFHQPLTELRADAQIGATLRREMEEELFGREDIDGTLGHRRRADPMHPSRLSEPMRWLDAVPGQG